MDEYLHRLICEKNRVFHELVKLERTIARRERHRSVPDQWLRQRDELHGAYREAKWALTLYRYFRREAQA